MDAIEGRTDSDDKPDTLVKACCGRCVYYLADKSKIGDGLCRRNPPQLVVTYREGDNCRWQSAFAPMRSVGWCGEFKMRDS